MELLSLVPSLEPIPRRDLGPSRSIPRRSETRYRRRLALSLSSMEDLSGRWWRPDDLIAASVPIRLSVSSRDFRHGDAMKPVREAIAAARLAELCPWNLDWEVWLVPKYCIS